MSELAKYFPGLTRVMVERLEMLEPLYREWNARINVVSRREMAGGDFFVRHVLHSLAIARVARFEAGATVLDIGTGGGFPAIPLAIVFPEVRFVAADSIGKKIRVVGEVARAVGLENLEAVCGRVESLPEQFDWVVSRAVAPAAMLVKWVKPRHGYWLLKGGDLEEELRQTGRTWREFAISDWFDEPFFETKKIISL